MSQPTWLHASKHAELLACLHQIAWADGSLQAVERDAVIRLVQSLGIEAARSEVIRHEALASHGKRIDEQREHEPELAGHLVSRNGYLSEACGQ